MRGSPSLYLLCLILHGTKHNVQANFLEHLQSKTYILSFKDLDNNFEVASSDEKH